MGTLSGNTKRGQAGLADKGKWKQVFGLLALNRLQCLSLRDFAKERERERERERGEAKPQSFFLYITYIITYLLHGAESFLRS